jgi:hypothetical protein
LSVVRPLHGDPNPLGLAEIAHGEQLNLPNSVVPDRCKSIGFCEAEKGAAYLTPSR